MHAECFLAAALRIWIRHLLFTGSGPSPRVRAGRVENAIHPSPSDNIRVVERRSFDTCLGQAVSDICPE